MNKLIDKILKCIAETFDLMIEDLDSSISQEDIDEWDSVGAVSLMICLEKKFNISITPETARKMVSCSTIENELSLILGSG